MLNLIIKNLSNYATQYKYIVASSVDGDLWFYGAWNDEDRAYGVARDIDGVVIKNPEKFMWTERPEKSGLFLWSAQFAWAGAPYRN